MLLFLITCSSFILFYGTLAFSLLWDSEMRVPSNLSLLTKSRRYNLLGASLSFLISRMLARSENVEITAAAAAEEEMSVLDLPELVFESILEKLPAEGLCRMASVCRSLRDRCVSDHLWEKHMENKWGRLAFKECQLSTKPQGKHMGFMGYLIALIRSGFSSSSSSKKKSCFDSIMSRYIALESGHFCFRAQVYNRENGHAGFMLSCYDAMVSYDRRTDTFIARYPPHGARACSVESGVTWDRLRSPLVETSPHHLHISDCLYELHPGDQIEIQWRRNKEFPYGWWYGVVGHLETCDGSGSYCRCHISESVVLEFNQYKPGSRWRRTIVNRKDHREEGDEAHGFYGGIHKLCGEEQISIWKKMWPAQLFE